MTGDRADEASSLEASYTLPLRRTHGDRSPRVRQAYDDLARRPA